MEEKIEKIIKDLEDLEESTYPVADTENGRIDEQAIRDILYHYLVNEEK